MEAENYQERKQSGNFDEPCLVPLAKKRYMSKAKAWRSRYLMNASTLTQNQEGFLDQVKN